MEDTDKLGGLKSWVLWRAPYWVLRLAVNVGFV